jgi:hypothetical protein
MIEALENVTGNKFLPPDRTTYGLMREHTLSCEVSPQSFIAFRFNNNISTYQVFIRKEIPLTEFLETLVKWPEPLPIYNKPQALKAIQHK